MNYRKGLCNLLTRCGASCYFPQECSVNFTKAVDYTANSDLSWGAW